MNRISKPEKDILLNTKSGTILGIKSDTLSRSKSKMVYGVQHTKEEKWRTLRKSRRMN
jgi:hypothetical protein